MARWLSGDGIEIGALHNPLAVPEGVTVRYVDRAPAEVLHTHYSDIPLSDFAPVSLLGDAHDLSALSTDSLDFVIANHLLEHLEDPIRGLAEMVRVLRPGGILYVGLPDPRASFDRHRQPTAAEHLVREYQEGTEATREQHYREWVDLVERHLPGGPVFADEASASARVARLMELDYSIHFHVWRPDTFLDFLTAARRECGLGLELLDFAACERGQDDEFIFVFAKGIDEQPPARPKLPPDPGDLDVAAARAELAALRASLSFRLGYFLLTPARAVRRRFGQQV
jgi:SAM-dependent methyltransferase